MRISDILARADSRQRSRARRVFQETVSTHSDDCLERRNRILKTSTESGLRLTLRKPISLIGHVATDFASASHWFARVYSAWDSQAGDQEADVEQMTQGNSSSAANTLSVVIRGAPLGATRTRRPNRPRLSLAERGDARSTTSFWPSSFISTWSPLLRFRAFRNRAGITSWPLVDSLEVLMSSVLHVLPILAKTRFCCRTKPLF